jgi:hypothetical protein
MLNEEHPDLKIFSILFYLIRLKYSTPGRLMIGRLRPAPLSVARNHPILGRSHDPDLMAIRVYSIWHSGFLGPYAGSLFRCYSRAEHNWRLSDAAAQKRGQLKER